MNNSSAQESIDTCNQEIDKIRSLIDDMGHTSPIVPFLTKYTIVKSCGTIEYAFKTIIADVNGSNNPQLGNYIDNTIRSSSMNPTFDNICRILKMFDDNWHKSFKKQFKDLDDADKIRDAIKSLNNARNSFAHGGVPSATFEDIVHYFQDMVKMIEVLDSIVHQQ